ncbi:MAG: Uncharacterized protein CEN91_607 [Candidatus Berkelbacteria bacterium Licking1014_85]|uniref:NAD-dependent epimerase/dehydratase domain-containing protein n=1 Tax=Candidatus Berkelbacteria bacterium Licking1014_85 TaxID=2017148 RepID=A0A554LGA8_9BACT|nr:MAG: Uncharacterized protein CEN91_607 [Candidatus Berkelbacteria bacterium Licking1014_85]
MKNDLKSKKILITGSAGLIGSESVKFFAEKNFEVIGIDNNMRQYFFGKEASTEWNRKLLEQKYKNYKHYNVDIRNDKTIKNIFQKHKFDLIIHTAAQPSHDWAAKEPYTDFSVNAMGTLVLLENFRKYCPNAVFIFTSTNKVYGDRPNTLPLIELKMRYELPKNHRYFKGIDETMSIDDCKHSLFGVSKVAADILVQEYGKYFRLKTGIFRYHYYKKPRCGEVYNMGGSRHSNISILEAIAKIEKILGKKAKYKYKDSPRIGDHIWYISDVSKFKKHFPGWDFKYDINMILEDICKHGHFEQQKKR